MPVHDVGLSDTPALGVAEFWKPSSPSVEAPVQYLGPYRLPSHILENNRPQTKLGRGYAFRNDTHNRRLEGGKYDPDYQAEIADRRKGGASMVAETTDSR